MRDPSPPVEAAQVVPEPKQFLTEEQFEEVWDLRGLKYRMDDLHVQLLSRGLNVSVDRATFRHTMHQILLSFFVQGDARIQAKHAPKPKFPKVF